MIKQLCNIIISARVSSYIVAKVNDYRGFNWHVRVSLRKYRFKTYDIATFVCEKSITTFKYRIQCLDVRSNDLWLFPFTKKSCLISKWLQKLKLSMPETGIKADNSAVLSEMIS